jgi:hypothetical protein
MWFSKKSDCDAGRLLMLAISPNWSTIFESMRWWGH